MLIWWWCSCRGCGVMVVWWCGVVDTRSNKSPDTRVNSGGIKNHHRALEI